MREKRTVQSSIFDLFSSHDLGRELKGMSAWLDEHPEVVQWVADDLFTQEVKPTGRKGLSAESVLRCALLKQHRQLSYEELAFHLSDSVSFQAFARLPLHWCPKKSVLQQTIGAIRAETWERINWRLLEAAREEKVERGERIRIDSTVTAAAIHAPSDSSLLWDSIRVMVRLLRQAQKLAGAGVLEYHDHRRVAKKRTYAIDFGRKPAKRVQWYKDLLKVTRATLSYLDEAESQLCRGLEREPRFDEWRVEVDHYRPLIERVIEQTERRVLRAEKVPAQEKVVSLGNPADSERFMPMIERHIACYGRAPKQVAADGGYASIANLECAKACGAQDVAFHKKSGLAIEAMVKNRWTYRRLRNFRAGIEAGISCLKRAYGLARCTWKGLQHFHAYVWSAVVAYNLGLFARSRTT